ncbi:MAG: hypothetical protein AAGA56_27300, partial [Myxococcota bacterium]
MTSTETSATADVEWLAVTGQSAFSLRVEGAQHDVAGTMVTRGSRPVFVPAFPLTPGLTYVVRGAGGCEKRLTVASADEPAVPRVTAIYPRGDSLPENLLRFYVYFSEPMAEGRFLDHLRLEELPSGRDLTGVFFDNVHELWSADRRRITLLVDPGRVKTGLHAHEMRGRAFHEGTAYRLTVLSSWRSLEGEALGAAVNKEFVALREDRAAVDPSTWR